MAQELSVPQNQRDWRAGRVASVLATLHRFLTADRPVHALLIGSVIFSAGYCLYLFDIRFLAGTSDFWTNARSLRGIFGADISTALSGYYFFVRDAWQLPLFHVGKLGTPTGTNIIYTDSIPLLALIGRLVYRLTGETVNLFGAWTAAAYILTATALTWLVATLGQRNVVAAAAATIIGVSIPPLLWRWGIPALLAHFEIVLALVFYFRLKQRCTPWSCFTAASLLIAMALTTNPYMFLMVGGIVAATLAQARLDRALSARSAAFVIVGVGVLIAVAMALCGHLESGDVSALGFGFYSMNVLSPVIPQMSGLIPGMASFVLDPTGGQYEGFNYLGAGVLLLIAAAVVSPAHSSRSAASWWYEGLRTCCAKHPCLLAVLSGFVFLAVSNFIVVGHSFVLQIPVPARLLELLGIFRSSGRLFWPAVYCITAVALVAVMTRYRRTAPALLIAAALLQWIDAAPLRNAVATSAAGTAPPVVEASAWRQAISHHSVVRILPPFACLGRPDKTASRHQIAIELQLLAAIEDVAVNSVYAGRGRTDCTAEAQPIGVSPANPGEIDIYLPESASFERASQMAVENSALCHSSRGLAVCTQELPRLDAGSLVKVSPAKWHLENQN